MGCRNSPPRLHLLRWDSYNHNYPPREERRPKQNEYPRRRLLRCFCFFLEGSAAAGAGIGLGLVPWPPFVSSSCCTLSFRSSGGARYPKKENSRSETANQSALEARTSPRYLRGLLSPPLPPLPPKASRVASPPPRRWRCRRCRPLRILRLLSGSSSGRSRRSRQSR